jgi:hypothetical protein
MGFVKLDLGELHLLAARETWTRELQSNHKP